MMYCDMASFQDYYTFNDKEIECQNYQNNFYIKSELMYKEFINYFEDISKRLNKMFYFKYYFIQTNEKHLHEYEKGLCIKTISPMVKGIEVLAEEIKSYLSPKDILKEDLYIGHYSKSNNELMKEIFTWIISNKDNLKINSELYQDIMWNESFNQKINHLFKIEENSTGSLKTLSNSRLEQIYKLNNLVDYKDKINLDKILLGIVPTKINKCFMIKTKITNQTIMQTNYENLLNNKLQCNYDSCIIITYEKQVLTELTDQLKHSVSIIPTMVVENPLNSVEHIQLKYIRPDDEPFIEIRSISDNDYFRCSDWYLKQISSLNISSNEYNSNSNSTDINIGIFPINSMQNWSNQYNCNGRYLQNPLICNNIDDSKYPHNHTCNDNVKYFLIIKKKFIENPFVGNVYLSNQFIDTRFMLPNTKPLRLPVVLPTDIHNFIIMNYQCLTSAVHHINRYYTTNDIITPITINKAINIRNVLLEPYGSNKLLFNPIIENSNVTIISSLSSDEEEESDGESMNNNNNNKCKMVLSVYNDYNNFKNNSNYEREGSKAESVDTSTAKTITNKNSSPRNICLHTRAKVTPSYNEQLYAIRPIVRNRNPVRDGNSTERINMIPPNFNTPQYNEFYNRVTNVPIPLPIRNNIQIPQRNIDFNWFPPAMSAYHRQAERDEQIKLINRENSRISNETRNQQRLESYQRNLRMNSVLLTKRDTNNHHMRFPTKNSKMMENSRKSGLPVSQFSANKYHNTNSTNKSWHLRPNSHLLAKSKDGSKINNQLPQSQKWVKGHSSMFTNHRQSQNLNVNEVNKKRVLDNELDSNYAVKKAVQEPSSSDNNSNKTINDPVILELMRLGAMIYNSYAEVPQSNRVIPMGDGRYIKIPNPKIMQLLKIGAVIYDKYHQVPQHTRVLPMGDGRFIHIPTDSLLSERDEESNGNINTSRENSHPSTMIQNTSSSSSSQMNP